MTFSVTIEHGQVLMDRTMVTYTFACFDTWLSDYVTDTHIEYYIPLIR
jgi:hypothetical protein